MTDDRLWEPRHYLAMAGREFGSRIDAIGAGDWDVETPCDGWSVRDLMNHVVAGNQLSVYRLGGSRHDEAAPQEDRDLLGDDPQGAFDRSMAAQTAAFAAAYSLERICESRIGEITGHQLLRFRALDLVVHSWDLARATGTNEHLDDELVVHTWSEIGPLVPAMGSMGVFGDGASGTLPEDAPLQLRLLDASGRRP